MPSHQHPPEEPAYGPGFAMPSNDPDWNAPAQWMSMRGWTMSRWLGMLILSVLGVIGAIVVIGREFAPGGDLYVGDGGATTAMIGPALLGLVYVGVWGSVLFLAVRFAPNFLTRQWVAADTHAVTLVAQPLLWYPGRRIQIPWSEIRGVSDRVKIRRSARRYVSDSGPQWRFRSYRVDFHLRHSAAQYQFPVWADSVERLFRLRGRPPKRAGKRFHVRTTKTGQRQLMTMLWTVRPDFFEDD